MDGQLRVSISPLGFNILLKLKRYPQKINNIVNWKFDNIGYLSIKKRRKKILICLFK
jgi:hypothetical protein